jgi:hypothetical protein
VFPGGCEGHSIAAIFLTVHSDEQSRLERINWVIEKAMELQRRTFESHTDMKMENRLII